MVKERKRIMSEVDIEFHDWAKDIQTEKVKRGLCDVDKIPSIRRISKAVARVSKFPLKEIIINSELIDDI